MTIIEKPSLEQLYTTLQSQLIEQDRQLLEKNQHIRYLEEQLAWFKRQIFGKRSEREVGHLNQEQLMFEGFENPEAPKEEEKTVAAYKRHKPNHNGQDKITLPPDLPVETTILDISEDQKVCQETGEALVQIGVEITHKLAHQPGSYYVKEIIRPKYAHPQREETGILTADLPESLLPRCRADESLLAEIITKKFADHLPLYRIAEIMGREKIKISRKLLSQWVIRTGMALRPLYLEMVKQVLSSDNIFIDESPVKLWEKNKCRAGYMWVVVGGKEADPPYRIYDFRDNRRHDNVPHILQD